MLQDMYDISMPVGLKMHLGNNKVIHKHVNKVDAIVDGKKIKKVDRYVYRYLMHMVTHTKLYDQLTRN